MACLYCNRCHARVLYLQGEIHFGWSYHPCWVSWIWCRLLCFVLSSHSFLLWHDLQSPYIVFRTMGSSQTLQNLLTFGLNSVGTSLSTQGQDLSMRGLRSMDWNMRMDCQDVHHHHQPQGYPVSQYVLQIENEIGLTHLGLRGLLIVI